MTPTATILMIITIASAIFGSQFWMNGMSIFYPKPNKKAAIVCFLITLAAFVANRLLQ